MNYWQPPRIRRYAIAIWHRNVLVWKRLIGPAMVLNFGEPTLYLLGLGYGLGFFIGEMGNMSYIAFLASGIVASSAMTTASFEGMYSVFTRMVPQRTYEAIMATPTDIDDILAGEMLWCGTKAAISGAAILIVALFLGVVKGWQAILVIPVVFLIGLCFAGPAIVMSALAKNYDFFNYYFVLIITPMLITSGVFYPIDTMPQTMQTLVHLLPLTHAVELTRPLITGQPLQQPLLNIAVLSGYAAVSYYIAVVMVRKKLLV
ncbi:MAG: ABC transporter permease [Gammaproteobacteria bacterium]|nr:ABC transporter permease [Gammaproteobacteria bacterium]MDH5651682.1 ABC transporter permease [Gammaproteobacteria bacterium]